MKKILVVDDDLAHAELIADFCQEAGFEARSVTNGLEAIDAVAAWQPDLITLDLEMPGASGLDVLRQLQSRPDTRRIPVVVISVVAKGALEEGELKGAQMVFEKPLKFQRLLQRLQQLLAGAAAKPAPGKPVFEPFREVSV